MIVNVQRSLLLHCLSYLTIYCILFTAPSTKSLSESEPQSPRLCVHSSSVSCSWPPHCYRGHSLLETRDTELHRYTETERTFQLAGSQLLKFKSKNVLFVCSFVYSRKRTGNNGLLWLPNRDRQLLDWRIGWWSTQPQLIIIRMNLVSRLMLDQHCSRVSWKMKFLWRDKNHIKILYWVKYTYK